VLRSSAVDLSEGEDIPETTHPVAETGDHGRRPKLPSEPQTGMATNEIVVTTREFELPVQSPLTTRMGRTASTQIGDRLPDKHKRFTGSRRKCKFETATTLFKLIILSDRSDRLSPSQTYHFCSVFDHMDMTLNRTAWQGVHIASHNNNTAGRVVRIQYQFWLILLGAIVCSLNLRAILEIIAMVHCRHFFAGTR